MFKFLKSLVSDSGPKVVTQIPEVAAAAAAAASPVTSIPSGPSCIKAVKPHVPLIKFRKGGPTSGGHSSSIGGSSVGGGGGRVILSHGTIEDYQLPPRYRRTPLDEKEIDYINRGGPE